MNDAAADLDILPLTRERLSDLAALFGQGGDPTWCWCAFFRLRQVDFAKATAESNRDVLAEAVETTAADGRAPGLIAYRGDEPVGWVSLGPRDDYSRLQHSRVLAPIDEKPVWSIVCFVVARQARNQGIATALLDAAIDYAQTHGATLLEAYPIDTEGERVLSANVYRGTLSMFQRAGFEIAAHRQATRASAVRPIVRRQL